MSFNISEPLVLMWVSSFGSSKSHASLKHKRRTVSLDVLKQPNGEGDAKFFYQLHTLYLLITLEIQLNLIIDEK